MKIAFVTFEYPPFIIGGAGVYADNLTRELVNLGHHITIFTPDLGNTYKKKGNLEICTIKINRNVPFPALQFWIKLPKEIQKVHETVNFDLVHFNGLSYWFLKKNLIKTPKVTTIHHSIADNSLRGDFKFFKLLNNSEENLFMLLIERRCIHDSDKLICVSEFTKNQIVNNYNTDIGKIKVIYQGVNPNNRDFSSSDLRKLKKDLKLKEIVILFVGRVDDSRKGLNSLIRAFKHIQNCVDASLLVVGKGNYNKSLKLAKSLKIDEKVVFTGFVDEETLYKYYNLCDVYVCPSFLEGFGLTIVEAILAGKPVVANKVGSIPELIIDKYNGILVDPGDIEVLSHAIIDCIVDECLIWDGEKREEFIKEKFSWKKTAEKTEILYSSLVI